MGNQDKSNVSGNTMNRPQSDQQKTDRSTQQQQRDQHAQRPQSDQRSPSGAPERKSSDKF